MYVNLVNLSKEEAETELLAALQERAKPDKKPAFPGRVTTAEEREMPNSVPFPGEPMTQQNSNYGRDQNIINQPSGNIRIGGS